MKISYSLLQVGLLARSVLTAPVVNTNQQLEERSQMTSLNVRNPEFAKRFFVFGLGLPIGVIIESVGGLSDVALSSISGSLNSVFKIDKGLPFDEGSQNCRMTITTWGGGHCDLTAMPNARSGTSQVTKHNDKENPWNVCWWDTEKKVSGQQYFDDPGIGKYMVEFMAKDSGETLQVSANAGPKHQTKCPGAGICHPKITFFRNDYNIVLYTYESVYQGNNYQGQSPGLCKGGVLNQFHKGGALFGHTCAVPCVNDASLPADITSKAIEGPA